MVGCSQNSTNIIPDENLKTPLKTIDSLITISNSNYSPNLSLNEFDNYLLEAEKIAINSNLKEKLFDVYIIVAIRYRNSSKYSEALRVLHKAITIANEIDSDKLRTKATHETAVNFRRINENAMALKLHTQALELAESINDTFLIHCSYNGIGNVYLGYKDYDNAIDYFRKSLSFIGKEDPNLLGKAINSNLLGEAWLYIGNADSALYYLQKSFDVNVEIGSQLGQAICYNGMGLVFYEEKKYSMALEVHNKAFSIYKTLDDIYYQSMCMNHLGKTYLATKNYSLAEEFLQKSLYISKSIGTKRFALETSINLAQLYNETDRAKLSYKFNVQAIAYKDSITEDLQKQNTEAMSVLYKASKQEREILILKQTAAFNELKINRQRYLIFGVTGLVIIFMLFVLFAYRQRQLKSRLNEISLEQKLLRAQLNPHFVFNSLSAVQNFILHNDKHTASEYLVNFSRLMRNILIGSGSDFIRLENELEILDDYLKLQQLRFMEKFDYFFEISDGIDSEICLVPPMLIQPFIENSIEHGVRGINRQGIITIRFIKEADFLVIEVEDNGRGIQDQKETEKKKGHISMATKITKQRMQNIQALTKKSCKFEVIDNMKSSGIQGVSVRIKIPFKEE